MEPFSCQKITIRAKDFTGRKIPFLELFVTMYVLTGQVLYPQIII